MPSRAPPGPSLPLPTGLGPPESSTGPSPLDTFTLPPFLPSRARPGSSPLDLWQCKRGYSQGSLVSLVFSHHVLMDTDLSVDLERRVMLQAACNKSTMLVMAVSWCGQASIMVVRRRLCTWQNHVTFRT